MRARLIGGLLSLAILLSGCAQAAPQITPKKANEIATANRRDDAKAAAKAKDASAKKVTGEQLHATDDHITSPNAAATAVKQVLKSPAKQRFVAVPTMNRDSQGHHYYQVSAYQAASHGHLLQTYFVYPDGTITTKQAN